MPKSTISDRVNDLFDREKWRVAQALLERERQKHPSDHWLLTQLGVAHYEQKRYAEALALFLGSREIVSDCPLTLWNLAGALDATGQSSEAAKLYLSILKSDTSPSEDPCWESAEWSDRLKADALYRLGLCFEHLGKNRKAEKCYRQYLDLILGGIQGMYSADETAERIRKLHTGGRTARSKLWKTVHAAL